MRKLMEEVKKGKKVSENIKRIVIMVSGRGSNMEAIINNVEIGFLQDKCEIIEVFADNIYAKGLQTAHSKGFKIFALDSAKYTRKEYNSFY